MSRPSPSPVRLYLVEDEAIIAMEIGDRLAHFGYEVCGQAASGEQALEEIPRLRPDLVLMDIHLAGPMNGIEAARRLRAQRDIPVVFLSAFSDPKLVDEAVQTGSSGYLVKPFEERELHATLQAALYKHKAEQLLRADNERLEAAVQQRSAELYASEARLKFLLTTSPVVVYSCRASGDYGATYVSDNIKAQLGYSPENFTRESGFWAAHIHPEDAPRVLADLAWLFEENSHVHEYRFRHADGTYRWMRDELRLVRDPDGNPAEIVGGWFDITERKQAEMREARQRVILADVRTAQQQFISGADRAQAFDHLLAALLRHTESEYGFIGEALQQPDGRPYLQTHAISDIAWNEETRRLLADQRKTGLRFENLDTLFGHVLTSRAPVITNDPAGDPRRGGLPAGHPPLRAFAGLPILVGHELVGMVGLANRPGGYHPEELAFIDPLLAAYGSLILAWRQRRLRQEAEESRRESEARLRDLFENTSDLIQSTAPDGTLLFVNRTWRETLGYTEEEARRLSVFSLIHPESREHCAAVFHRLMQGEPVGLVDVAFVARDGRRIELEGNISVRLEDGRPVSTRGIFRDVTEARLRAAAEKRRLEQTSAYQAALLALRDHEAEEPAEYFRAATECLGRVLRLDRAGLWLFDETRTAIVCQDLWQADPGSHEQGGRLAAADYPRYFAAIEGLDSVLADEARHDPRTSEFARGYLDPLGLTSLLDVPIRVGGRLAGVICCEHGDPARRWTSEENKFAVAVASYAMLALEQAERRRAERALRESESRFRQLAETISQVFWVSSPDATQLHYISPGFEQIWGRPVQDVYAQPLLWTEAILPEDRPSVFAALEHHAQGRFDIEYRIVRPDGSRRWIHDRGYPVRDESGHIVRMVGLAEDITARKSAEEEVQRLNTNLELIVEQRTAQLAATNAALAESEARFRHIFENSPVGIYRTTPEGRILLANHSLARMLGYASPPELLARNLTDASNFPEKPRTAFQERLGRDGQLRGFETVWCRKDGTPVHVSENAIVMRDAAGQPLYYDGTAEDITARRAAEMALRENEEKFRAVFDKSPIPVVLAEFPGGRIVEGNAAALTAFGYGRGESIGRTTVDLGTWVHPGQRERFLALLQRDGAVTGYEVELRHRDGTVRTVLFSCSLIGIGEGRYTLTSLLDVTERRQTQEALRASEARYRALVESSTDAIFLLDAAGRILSANPAAATMHGYTLEELLSLNVRDLDTPDSAQHMPGRLQRLLGGEHLVFEIEHRRKDGSVFPLEVSAAPLRIGAETFVLASERDITQRREHETEIHRLALLARKTDNAVIITDPDRRVQWVNDGFTRIAGYTLEDIRGRNPAELLHGPATDRAVLAELRRQLAIKANVSVELVNYHKSGEPYWVHLTIQPMHGTRGEVTGFFSTSMDITERKLAEQALQLLTAHAVHVSTGQYYEEIAAGLSALLEVDQGFICTYLPGDRSHFHSHSHWRRETDHPRHLGQVRSTAGKACAALEHSPFVLFAENASGLHPADALLHDRGIEGYAAIELNDSEGRPIGFLGIMSSRPLRRPGRVESLLRLFAVRVAAEISRHQTEAKFRDFFEFSPDAVLIAGHDMVITDVNLRTCELFGYTREELVGQHADRLIPEQHRPALLARLQTYFANPTPHAMGTSAPGLYGRHRNGRAFPIDIGLNPLQTPRGLLVVAAVRDTTKQLEAEELRLRAEQEIRQAQKMDSLGTLAGGIAHDFNNILTGMLGFVELARLDVPDMHPARQWIEQIGTSGLRAKSLVRHILTFSRKDMKKEHVPTRLQAVVHEALDLLRSSVPAMVRIERHLAKDCPPVMADASQIHQIVMNLGTNAWRALPESGGLIRVELVTCTITPEEAASLVPLRPGTALKLSVTDNGCGMEPAVLERIFEPFFTTRPVGEGTGLGLSTVHGIVQAHDGAIRVASTPGKGTRFDLYLPAILDDAPPAAPDTARPRGRGERILLVDDDPQGNAALTAMLTRFGYDVASFRSPTEALAHVGRNPARIDVVVTDYAMPAMSGIAFLRELRQARPELRALLVSGNLGPAQRSELARDALTRTLDKPVEIAELAAALEQVLRPPAR